ncbi:unnamed protein product [Prorocentrum cordatum]|uniref:Uncharacterized protein n=1 Tax=Prorocentrum cordatum TaxID=2364126 RepID=A0ABN9QMQ8_9DINO|nr:unnamed protein product [Polarella glacialis]
MVQDWVLGTQRLVWFVTDPGFKHERVIVWPCHEASWIEYTGSGDLHGGEEKDLDKVYLMTAGQPPRSLPDYGAKVVPFAKFPTDDELRGLIAEAHAEVASLWESEPDRHVPADPTYFLSEEVRQHPLLRHRLPGKQVRRDGKEGNPPVADAGAGAAESGGVGDAGDGVLAADGDRHRWLVTEPGLIWELGALVPHACATTRLGDRGVADIDGETEPVQSVPEADVGDYASMKTSAYEVAVRDFDGAPTDFGRTWLDLGSRSNNLGPGHWVMHELSVLCEVFYVGRTYDQLNMPSLVSFKNIGRRIQSIADAYSGDPFRPQWANARLYSGVGSAVDMVVPELKHYVAKRAKDEIEVESKRVQARSLPIAADAVAAGSLPAAGRGPPVAAAAGQPSEGLARGSAEIFPLPDDSSLVAEFWIHLQGRAQRRFARDWGQRVRSLNWLWGAGHREAARRAQGDVHPYRFRLQREVLVRIAQGVQIYLDPPSDLSPKEAFQGLLRGRGVYDTETAYTTLAPYQRGAVSLPCDVSTAPAVGTLVTGRALEYLVEAEEQMIRTDAEVQLDRETNGEIKIYTDPLLANSRRRYSTFVKDLKRKGLVGFTRDPKEFVGVFFVWKKERASMRMVLDCRRSNQRFVTPPGVELLSTEGLGRIECDTEQTGTLPIFPGKADVKDCFHRMMFGNHLSKYFCYPGGLAKEFGIVGQLVEGVPARAGDYLWPCALALPMGWTWSLYFAQVANLGLVERVPAVASSCAATDRGPPIVLSPTSSWHYVYVDHVGLLSLDASYVKGALADTVAAFDAAGLIMHDISVDSDAAEALGVTLDGQKHQTLVNHRRYWKVRLGLRRALSLRRLAGRELEVLLGHCKFVGLMCRETLSAWHTVYTFIRERCWAKSDVWESARQELECFLGLMPPLRSEWDRPWLTQVLSVDASPYGWGIASSEFGVSTVKKQGRIPLAWWLTDTDPETSCLSLRIYLDPTACRLKFPNRPRPLILSPAPYSTIAMKRTRTLEAPSHTIAGQESRTRTLPRPEIRSKLDTGKVPMARGSLVTLAAKGPAWATAAVTAAATGAAADVDSDGTTTADEMEKGLDGRRGMHAMGLAVMNGVSCYLRPSELLDLTSDNLVAPTSPVSRYWSLLLHPSEEEKRSKTGDADDSPIIDSAYMLSWVHDLLQVLKEKGGRLWSVDYLTFLAEFKTVAKTLAMPHLVPYRMSMIVKQCTSVGNPLEHYMTGKARKHLSELKAILDQPGEREDEPGQEQQPALEPLADAAAPAADAPPAAPPGQNGGGEDEMEVDRPLVVAEPPEPNPDDPDAEYHRHVNIWTSCTDAGSDEANARKLMGQSLNHDSRPNDIFFDGNCLAHQAHLVVKGQMVFMDKIMLALGMKNFYWTVPPKPLVGRWGAISDCEKYVLKCDPKEAQIVFKAVFDPEKETSKIAGEKKGKQSGIAELATEDRDDYKERMSKWILSAFECVCDRNFWIAMKISQKLKGPVDHLFNIIKQRREYGIEPGNLAVLVAGAALGMVLRRLGDAVGTTLRCENKFAIEKREESRVELMCHDCAPTCVFEDMMDFVNPKVRRVLESQGARMKFDDIVKIFKSGMAIKSKARCRIHCKECDALYCRLHTAGTPCVVWSPQGPQVGVDDLEFLLCFLAWCSQRLLIKEDGILHENVPEFPVNLLDMMLGEYLIETIVLSPLALGHPVQRERRITWLRHKKTVTESVPSPMPWPEFSVLFHRECDITWHAFFIAEKGDLESELTWATQKTRSTDRCDGPSTTPFFDLLTPVEKTRLEQHINQERQAHTDADIGSVVDLGQDPIGHPMNTLGQTWLYTIVKGCAIAWSTHHQRWMCPREIPLAQGFGTYSKVNDLAAEFCPFNADRLGKGFRARKRGVMIEQAGNTMHLAVMGTAFCWWLSQGPPSADRVADALSQYAGCEFQALEALGVRTLGVLEVLVDPEAAAAKAAMALIAPGEPVEVIMSSPPTTKVKVPAAGSAPTGSAGPFPTAGTGPTHSGTAVDALFGSRATIEDREGFKDVTGSMRWNMIEKAYVKPQRTTLHLVDDKGERIAFRHRLNQRVQKVVVLTYARGVLQNGAMAAMRAAPIVIAGDGGKMEIIGGGTLVDSIFVAKNMQPENPHVVRALATGIPNCIEFDSRTPDDVITWVKNEHNNWHSGSKYSCLEMYNELETIEAAWKEHKTKHNITVHGCPSSGDLRYSKLFEKFVLENFEGVFEDGAHLTNARSFANAMKEMGIWEWYKDLLGERCDFLRPGLSNQVVAFNNYNVLNLLRTRFSDTIDEGFLTDIIKECVRFMVPLADVGSANSGSGGNGRPGAEEWLFDKMQMKLIRLLICPMGGSVLYKDDKQEKLRQKRAAKESRKEPKKVAKKDKKDNVRQQQKPKLTVDEEVMSLETMGRDKLFLDDLAAVITAPLKDLEADDINRAEIALVIRDGLRFCFKGEIWIAGETKVAWSHVRKALRGDIIRIHATPLMKLPGLAGDLENASSEEITSSLLHLLAVDDLEEAAPAGSAMAGVGAGSEVKKFYTPQIAAILQEEQSGLLDLSSFVKSNLMSALPARVHPAFISLSSVISNNMVHWDVGVKNNLEAILTQISAPLLDAIPHWWVRFAQLVPLAIKEQKSTVEYASGGVFPTADTLEQFMSLRIHYMIELLLIAASCSPVLAPHDQIQGLAASIVANLPQVVSALDAKALKQINFPEYCSPGQTQQHDFVRDWVSIWSEVIIWGRREMANTGKFENLLSEIIARETGASDSAGGGAAGEGVNGASAASASADGGAAGGGANGASAASASADGSGATGGGASGGKGAEAPGPQQPEEDQSTHVISLSELRGQWKDDENDLPPLVLRNVIQKIEATLYEKCVVSGQTSLKPESHQPDSGTTCLHCNPDKPEETLVSDRMGKNFVANLFGRVVRVASAGCIPLTKIGNVMLYASGEGVDTTMTDEFVPAWLIKEAKQAEVDAMKAGKCTVLDVKCSKIPFSYAYTVGMEKKMIECDLDVWSCRWPQGLEKAINGPVYRQTVSGMLSKTPQATARPRLAKDGTYMADLFSGSGKVARAVTRLGFSAKAWDIIHGPNHDITDPAVLRLLFSDVRDGKILAAMIALPCTSLTIARDRTASESFRMPLWQRFAARVWDLAGDPVYNSLGAIKVRNYPLGGLEGPHAAKLFMYRAHRLILPNDFPADLTQGRRPSSLEEWNAMLERNPATPKSPGLLELHPLLESLKGNPERIRAMASRVVPNGPTLLELGAATEAPEVEPVTPLRRGAAVSTTPSTGRSWALATP